MGLPPRVVYLRADQASVRDSAAHAGDETHATWLPKTDHLASHSLSSHENSGDVDTQHLVGVFGGVLEGWCLLLDTGCGYQTVETAVLSGTSMAAPLVAGLGAYLLALEGERSPTELCDRMVELSTKDAVSGLQLLLTDNNLAYNGV